MEEEKNETYLFPPKIIAKVILEETESKINTIRKYSQGIHLDSYDEFREMLYQHKRMISNLSTYEDIDTWLSIYRRMSLREWVDSL